jgi:transcriptional regulator with XRE-family HTH domain
MSDSYKDKTDNSIKNRDRFFVGSGINRFGERLKAAMESKGITSNVKMGSLSDMSDTVIRNYLIGKTYPTLDRLAVLAYVLECTPEWLLTGRDVNSNIKHDDEQITEASAAPSYPTEFEVIIKRLPLAQREALLDAIIQYGVTGIISALKGMASVAEFTLLPEQEKQQLMRLHNEVKKGAPEDSKNNELNLPDHKQAG